MHTRFLMPALLLAALSSPAAAITLGQEDIPDPIKPGATCTVPVPNSYGSYIYHYPSKYELVFWPHAAANMIWFCPESGFASFIGDADKLSDADKAALTTHLAANYRKGTAPPTELEKIALLRQSYAHRKQEEAPRIAMLRALAYMYEEAGDAKNAEALRREALAAIHARLAGAELDEPTRLEYLFVSAAYEREFGDPARSDAQLKLLDSKLLDAKDPKLQDYVEYLGQLRREIPLIQPGGVLAPVAGAEGR
ncbi:MAG: hypothetical protein HOQ32_11825 [Lysobacter sp.]|nr:hypothetical protein [Lysobacter sp.]